MQAIILILASVNILMTISLLFSLMASERRRKGKEDISNDAIARLESYISRGFETLISLAVRDFRAAFLCL